MPSTSRTRVTPHPVVTTLPLSAAALLGILLISCAGARPEQSAAPDASSPPQGIATEAGREHEDGDTGEKTETSWLALLINGQKSGYLKATRTVSKDRVVTSVTTSMEMKRGPAVTRMLTVSTMTETRDGKPLKVVEQTEGPGMSRTVTGVITPDGRLRLTTESGGSVSSKEVDWVEGALMAEGQRLESLRYGLKEGVEYTSTYFDPDLLLPLEVHVKVGERETVDLMGRVVEGTRVTLTMNVLGSRREIAMWVDDRMNTLKTDSMLMGMRIEMLDCTEQYALSDNDPQELIRATFVKSPRALSPKERQKPLTYTLRRTAGSMPLHIISTGEQTVIPREDAVAVTVSLPGPKTTATSAKPYRGDDPEILAALQPNEWIQSDAAEIRELAKTAVSGAADPRTAAASIERFVSQYIEIKSLSVGYASALEVAKSRQGDCTEHAVLAAALCRAAGIPAQIVSGLLYVDAFGEARHMFGGHAWTRIYVDGEWVSLDAAVGAFDTGHLALSVSNGNPTDFFHIIDIIGDLEIVSIH